MFSNVVLIVMIACSVHTCHLFTMQKITILISRRSSVELKKVSVSEFMGTMFNCLYVWMFVPGSIMLFASLHFGRFWCESVLEISRVLILFIAYSELFIFFCYRALFYYGNVCIWIFFPKYINKIIQMFIKDPGFGLSFSILNKKCR